MRTGHAALGRGAFARPLVGETPDEDPVLAGLRPRRRGGLVLRFSVGAAQVGHVIGDPGRGKLFAKDVFALGRAHDELLVSGEFGGAGDVHRVDGVEQTGQTVLRRVGKVVVQGEEEDGLWAA